jgi:hypothetical protein
MPNRLQVLVRSHCAERNLSARNLAARIGIGYPAALAVLRKGAVPRKPEHREALRNELGLDAETWAQVVAGSQRGGVEIPEEGPLTLQHLVMQALLAKSFTEQSFARVTGIAYPTVMGITRKGSVPRTDTLAAIAGHLGLSSAAIAAAVAASRAAGKPTARVDVAPVEGGVAIPEDVDPSEVHLAQAAMDAVHRSGDSMAGFARAHDLPYLRLSRLIATGAPPEDAVVLERLRGALGLDGDHFAEALAQARTAPVPATPPTRESDAVTPLQAALIRLVSDRRMTVKAFADAADLSVLTATRLLKRGDLPGRATTHLKLRTLLGLGQSEYDNLLARSRQALGVIPRGIAPTERSDDDDGLEPHPMEPIPGAVRTDAVRDHHSTLILKPRA